jgi:hypothetical protein
VGGTALALYMGHRKSIDFALFSEQLFDVSELEKYFVQNYGFITARTTYSTLIGNMYSIKVDCVGYNYPLVEPSHEYDGIRMYSMPDIAAMKLTAISQSGNRLKDFVDVAFMSSGLSLENMLSAFEKKYHNVSAMTAVRGITYYDDIDFSAKINLMEGNFKWRTVEKRLKDMIKYSDRIFPKMVFK